MVVEIYGFCSNDDVMNVFFLNFPRYGEDFL